MGRYKFAETVNSESDSDFDFSSSSYKERSDHIQSLEESYYSIHVFGTFLYALHGTADAHL